ncbi:MAG TPA: hypothetical protein VF194_02725 [Ferrovibrio sp.]|uniref:hypothetical protein n=1 Tax=Ferrovibrio sp. TaxID=1917215 RepID=UPI002ED500DF
MTTRHAINALASLEFSLRRQAPAFPAGSRYRWLLLDACVRDVTFPHLGDRNLAFARAAVALHRATGLTLADRCHAAANNLEVSK